MRTSMKSKWQGIAVAVGALAAFATMPVACGGSDGSSTTSGGTGHVDGGGAGGGGGFTGGTGGTGATGGTTNTCPGATLCNGKCVDTNIDPTNCGSCNTTCQSGEVCSSGQCGLTCGGGTTKCGSACVDTNVDPANCGACGTACQSGEVCSNGTCSSQCLGGTTNCNSKCVDTQIDPANCGTCGTACQSGEVCSAGTCASQCLGATTDCSGKCVDTQIDPANCGTCGTACQSGEVCSNGACGVQCTGGTTLCGTACTNTNTDPANCGTCGTQCQSGEVCSNGVCGLSCSGGTTKCGTACVNTDIDTANCGSCGNACQSGEVCASGVCGLVCSGGTTKCGTSCVNTDTNPAHCGGCNNACPSGNVCSGGTCTLNCGGGSTKCGNTCVDTKTDPANCGGCGTQCTTGQVCNNGVCASVCGGSLTKCGNNCVNTDTDPANCGSCGNACALGAVCVSGVCQQCNSATTDCDGDGWLVSEGDCCDKPGTCGLNPALVNPGAYEVVGNAVDDNCNGLVDLFDVQDAVSCDTGLSSSSSTPGDYAKAMGICRTTTETPAQKKDKTWGLISAEILRADGSALAYAGARSIRTGFGSVNPKTTEGSSIVVVSSGVAADATQTSPGPNGGAPGGSNVSNSHSPSSAVNISTCTNANCIKDWFQTANAPLKAANALPVAPSCGSGTSGNPSTANDSVMIKFRLRAPTNAKAFSFNSYFLSAEYPEFVCSSYNDQLIALVTTPNGTPSPIPNPVDRNLMTFLDSSSQKWPIGINIAKGTNLFAVCESQTANPGCWDTDVNTASCSLGITQLAGTGFDKPGGTGCTIGGGTHWLTTAGNVIPGDIVEVRIVIWDVGDSIYDSTALLDGFKWLPNATLPGTG